MHIKEVVFFHKESRQPPVNGQISIYTSRIYLNSVMIIEEMESHIFHKPNFIIEQSP